MCHSPSDRRISLSQRQSPESIGGQEHANAESVLVGINIFLWKPLRRSFCARVRTPQSVVAGNSPLPSRRSRWYEKTKTPLVTIPNLLKPQSKFAATWPFGRESASSRSFAHLYFALSSFLNTAPSRITNSTFFNSLMSRSGSPLTAITSANAPGAITPISPFISSISAAREVAD